MASFDVYLSSPCGKRLMSLSLLLLLKHLCFQFTFSFLNILFRMD